MKYLYQFTVLFFLTICCDSTFAQVQDPNSPGFDYATPDTTIADSSGMMDIQPGGSKDPALRIYARLNLNIDSATNLITYGGVVEQEESGSDSLYVRAKRWAINTLGKEIKVELDKRNQKIIYVGSIPAYVYMNKYSKRAIGKFEFKITFLIKEGRYKYQITNLVHETVKPSDGSKGSRNYFEYYYTATTRVRENDIILRNADKDILRMIHGIQNALNEPKMVDEDDW
ncbi:MAG: DUF4468 domain-containing protein [Bacteroidia bacterium]|nr:DUF4468 domain-containing protein [Bacteroidia bacterium]